MRILFLDDMEERHHAFRKHVDSTGVECTYVFNAEDAIKALDGERFDVAFLDHDLGERDYQLFIHGIDHSFVGSGMDVVDHIILMSVENRPRQVVVHTWNSRRGHEMMLRLWDAGVHVLRIPFDPQALPKLPKL